MIRIIVTASENAAKTVKEHQTAAGVPAQNISIIAMPSGTNVEYPTNPGAKVQVDNLTGGNIWLVTFVD